MSSASIQIEREIKDKRKGDLIFPTDFRGIGIEGAIKMALTRPNKEGVIQRLGHGIYLLPKTDPVFGKISPAPEEIANAIAKRDKINIKPAGAYALHKLGLTTQVPTKLVYLTNGPYKEIKIGKTTNQLPALIFNDSYNNGCILVVIRIKKSLAPDKLLTFVEADSLYRSGR